MTEQQRIEAVAKMELNEFRAEYKQGYRDGAQKVLRMIQEGWHKEAIEEWTVTDLFEWICDNSAHRAPQPGEYPLREP